MGSKGEQAAGVCSAVQCSACVKEQTGAQGSKSQVRQTRCASISIIIIIYTIMCLLYIHSASIKIEIVVIIIIIFLLTSVAQPYHATTHKTIRIYPHIFRTAVTTTPKEQEGDVHHYCHIFGRISATL
jgi:hypothetical protein